MGVQSWLWAVVVVVVAWSGSCQGHGRLIDPPSRASAWRYGFDTPTDYEDDEGFCGGLDYQYEVMDGKCGICGDAWDENPRPHEAGGMYATGTIVRTYSEGEVITVKVEITANHKGHFEFRICPNNNPSVEASQTCLNANPLPLADGSGYYHYISPENGVHTVNLKLPSGLTCTQCVFQWRYVAANNWGTCENGTEGMGCGPQEEFRACADVAISGSGASWTDAQIVASEVSDSKTAQGLPRVIQPPTTASNSQGSRGAGGSGDCRAVGKWKSVRGMDAWCENNCNHVQPYCPSSHCICG